MKLALVMAFAMLLTACDDKTPEQKLQELRVQEQLMQNQQQQPGTNSQPVIINQAPAQSHDSMLMPLVGGALLGHALSGGGNNRSTHTTRIIERPTYRPAPTYRKAPIRTVSRPAYRSSFRGRK